MNCPTCSCVAEPEHGWWVDDSEPECVLSGHHVWWRCAAGHVFGVVEVPDEKRPALAAGDRVCRK